MKKDQCSNCNGLGVTKYSCCGDNIVEQAINICPTCHEYASLATVETCTICNGSGVDKPSFDENIKFRECPFCEGLGVEDPEMDPAEDCPECEGMGVYPLTTAPGTKINVEYSDAELALLEAHFKNTGMIPLNVSRTGRISSYDRNETVQDFSIHKSRRLVDLQGESK